MSEVPAWIENEYPAKLVNTGYVRYWFMDASVKSSIRTLQVLELLGSANEGLSLNDVCTSLDMPKSSGHALLRTMTTSGWIDYSDATHQYGLGSRVWEVARRYISGLDLQNLARPYMEAVRNELDETVQLATLDGVENVYIAKVEAQNQRLVLVSHVGARLPAWATGLGKAMLAELSEGEIDARFDGVTFERFTDATIDNLDDLKVELKKTAERGYAVDESEYADGVFCVAVPILNARGDLVAAISVSVPEVRRTPTLEARIAALLQDSAAGISNRLSLSG